jgi:hypothetical protein
LRFAFDKAASESEGRFERSEEAGAIAFSKVRVRHWKCDSLGREKS